ncbi:MAG: flagellar protein FlgN [Spirochaetes bacterium]|nr:flagellar protein FlgN [Spirochaetota bacterium]
MKRSIDDLINIITKQYDVYTEIFFNEIDKGFLLFINDISTFNTLNENSKKLINTIINLEKEKGEVFNELIHSLNIKNNYNNDIYLLIKNHFPEKLDQFEILRTKFSIVLKNSKIINNKIMILLNSGISFINSIYKTLNESFNTTTIYNNKGNIDKKEFVRFYKNI